ncbi:MAG: Ribosomal RNA small subunit methyltransferase H [Opitutia bacterium UBA7350]|nr:MAG: Ribosomal RNA small subunit methyltransferase H [Opitutae bacterium UBA7350]
MRLTQRVHDQLKAHLRPGDFAVDATAGNGHDSLLLAELVGSSGRVSIIDVQAAAIDATQKRLHAAGYLEQAQFHQDNHATVLAALAKQSPGKASAIVFNLGYLPGSDKLVQTKAHHTLSALNASTQLLAPNGLLMVTAYRGHSGGADEAESIATWAGEQEALGWVIKCYDPGCDKVPLPPVLWILTPPTTAP